MNIKINHATQKTQRQTHGPTGLCQLFLLTVPIEEVARWQYINDHNTTRYFNISCCLRFSHSRLSTPLVGLLLLRVRTSM